MRNSRNPSLSGLCTLSTLTYHTSAHKEYIFKEIHANLPFQSFYHVLDLSNFARFACWVECIFESVFEHSYPNTPISK